MKRGSTAELQPCLGQGASLGEEAVLADSGRAGEVTARVGRVRSLDFLSILEGDSHVRVVDFVEIQNHFPKPVIRNAMAQRKTRTVDSLYCPPGFATLSRADVSPTHIIFIRMRHKVVLFVCGLFGSSGLSGWSGPIKQTRQTR